MPIVCTGESHWDKLDEAIQQYAAGAMPADEIWQYILEHGPLSAAELNALVDARKKRFRDLAESRSPDIGSWHGFARFAAHRPCDCHACRRAASSTAVVRATSPRWLNHQHQRIGLRTP